MKKLFTVLAVLLVATALFAQVGLTVKAGGAFGFDSYKSIATAKDDKTGEELKYEDVLVDKALILKSKGFGFDVGAQYDITDKLLAYVDFNMFFSKDFKTNNPVLIEEVFESIEGFVDPDDLAEMFKNYSNDEGKLIVFSASSFFDDLKKLTKDNLYYDIGEEAKVVVKNSFFSISAGAAYKFDFNAIKLNVGGGVTINKGNAFVAFGDKDEYDKNRFEFKTEFTSFGLNAMVEAKYMVAQNIGVGVTLIPQLGLYSSATMTFSMITETDTTTESLSSKGFALSFAMPIVVGVSYTF